MKNTRSTLNGEWNLVKSQIPKDEETVYKGIILKYDLCNLKFKTYLDTLMNEVTEQDLNSQIYLVKARKQITPLSTTNQYYFAITKPMKSTDKRDPEEIFENVQIESTDNYIYEQIKSDESNTSISFFN